MAGFNLNISGIKQVENAINRFDKAATKGIVDELSASVLNIQKAAKRRAPGFDGKLRQSIIVSSGRSGLDKSVVATVKYAPYVEFGTRSKVRIPPGYEGFAAQFRGKGGGTFKELFDSIVRWVKKKNIAQIQNTYTGRRSTRRSDVNYAAMTIAWRIIKNGVRPQPFLIPSYEEEKPKLINRLRRLFK
jgi:HK97 gp10 family phage protein